MTAVGAASGALSVYVGALILRTRYDSYDALTAATQYGAIGGSVLALFQLPFMLCCKEKCCGDDSYRGKLAAAVLVGAASGSLGRLISPENEMTEVTSALAGLVGAGVITIGLPVAALALVCCGLCVKSCCCSGEKQQASMKS